MLCSDDLLWSAVAWDRALPALAAAGCPVVAFWTCAARSGGTGAGGSPLWFLRTFGLPTFALLCLFLAGGLASRLLRGRPMSVSGCARRHGVPHARVEAPNSAAFAAEVEAAEIDVLVLMFDRIAKPALLAAPRLATINKHAAILPANRGLFPYFWARLKGEPQGVSFHVVEEEIDSGACLLQRRIEGPETASMVRFYRRVFLDYGSDLAEAVARLCRRRFEEAPVVPVESSYQSLPTRADARAFAAAGGRLVRARDLLLAGGL